ncbi:MAG: Gfo/Idh/MocA family oxidoreductase [Vicinamibacteraceae bacterium]
MSAPLRFAVFGAGFWAPYQLSGWREVGGVECVAIYNRTRKKAEALAQTFAIPAVFEDPAQLLEEIRPDFVDIVTEVGGHKPLSLLCARARIACICQKPLAESYREAVDMVGAFRRTRTPFFVHENWRWQAPFVHLRRLLATSVIGRPLRARLSMVSGFDVYANQPALRGLERFILSDLGTHVLDVCRVLFGEARSLYCRTARPLAPTVTGESLATVLLTMGSAETHVSVELGYNRTPLEPSTREVFPQTLGFIEGSRGSIELSGDYVIRVTTQKGTRVTRHAPPRYAWADPRYDVAHASIVPCCADLLGGLRGRGGQTTGEDNLKTLRLVFAAYDSARTGRAIRF